MRAGKIYMLIFGSFFFLFGVIFLFAMYGYYHALDQNGSVQPGIAKFQSQMMAVHQNIKIAKNVDEFKSAFHGFDENKTLNLNSRGLEKIKEIYAGLMTVFGSRLKETEERSLIGKKRDLMEGLVNAYRKEIPKGDLRVRAGYLNILFDTQNSLLNDGDPSESLYVQKTKEKFLALKQVSGSIADSGLQIRVANLESTFLSYDKGFDSLLKWKNQKQELAVKTEKNLLKVIPEMYSAGDGDIGRSKTIFASVGIFGLAFFVLGFFLMLLVHRILTNRYIARIEALRKCFAAFGREVKDTSIENGVSLLKNDPEWKPIVQTMRKAELDLLSEYQTQFALARSLKVPFLIFDRSGSAKIWNREAADLFHLMPERDYRCSEIIHTKYIGVRAGDEKVMIDTIHQSLAMPTEDTFEITFKSGGGAEPMELICNAVTSGPLTGGKIFLFRKIRSEVDRIQAAVDHHLKIVRDFIASVSQQLPFMGNTNSENPAVSAALKDLKNMQFKQEEREKLWKNENHALLDQVSRQREVLAKLTDDLESIRKNNQELNVAVKAIHSFDCDLSAGIIDTTHEISNLGQVQERIIEGVRMREKFIVQASEYESVSRQKLQELQDLVQNRSNDIAEIKVFIDSAKLLVVNMSLGETSKENRAFASRARAFLLEVQNLYDQVTGVLAEIEHYLQKQPESSLFPSLDSSNLSADLFDGFSFSQEKVQDTLKRWKVLSEQIVVKGEHALAIIHNQELNGEKAMQLGETSILINDQAKGNLQRWS